MKLWHYPLYRVNGGYPTDCDRTNRAASRREAVFALAIAPAGPISVPDRVATAIFVRPGRQRLDRIARNRNIRALVMDFRDNEQGSARDGATLLDDVGETV